MNHPASGTEPGTAEKPRLGRDVYVLGTVAFFVMVGFGVVIPVLPVFVRNFGVGNTAVGFVVSAFAFMRLLSSPFCGWLIKKGGERTILAIGVGIVAASSALVGLSHTFAEALIWRGVGGIGSAMFTVSAMTLLLGSTPLALRGRAVSIYQGGFLIGGMAGPALGGLLALISLRAPFFFYAGTLVIAGLVALFLLGKKRAEVQESAAEPEPFSQVVRDVRYRSACLANFSQGWAGLGVRSALVPVLVVQVLHQDPAFTGIAFAIAAVVQTLMLGPAGTLVDRVGRKPALIGGYALAAVSLAFMPFAPQLWMLVVLLALYGAASAFAATAPAALVGDVAKARGGTPVAIFSMSSDLGAIIGPVIAGLLADSLSLGAAFDLGAVLLLVSSLYGIRIPERRRSLLAR